MFSNGNKITTGKKSATIERCGNDVIKTIRTIWQIKASLIRIEGFFPSCRFVVCQSAKVFTLKTFALAAHQIRIRM